MKKNREEIIKRISDLFSKHFTGEILAVLLFGSVAQEKTNSESDIDIAVLFDFAILKEQRKQLVYDIYERIPYYFIEPVDIVNLNDADLILSYQILTKGELILCRRETEFKIFRDSRLVQYLDFNKFLEPFYPK